MKRKRAPPPLSLAEFFKLHCYGYTPHEYGGIASRGLTNTPVNQTARLEKRVKFVKRKDGLANLESGRCADIDHTPCLVERVQSIKREDEFVNPESDKSADNSECYSLKEEEEGGEEESADTKKSYKGIKNSRVKNEEYIKTEEPRAEKSEQEHRGSGEDKSKKSSLVAR